MKKIFGFLISLIVLVTLTACDGGNTVVEATPTPPAELVITEPTPEPPAPTEEVIEEPTPEPEPIEEPTPEPAEPSDEEIIAEVLANDEYYEDGAFCPKLYAEAIGYKWWADIDGEADYSIIVDDVEYFFFFKTDSALYSIAYTDGDKCYMVTVYDIDEIDRESVIKFKSADRVNFNTERYIGSAVLMLKRVAEYGASDMSSWEYPTDLSYSYSQFDCKPGYYDDGFIKYGKFDNLNEANSFLHSYKDE